MIRNTRLEQTTRQETLHHKTQRGAYWLPLLLTAVAIFVVGMILHLIAGALQPTLLPTAFIFRLASGLLFMAAMVEGVQVLSYLRRQNRMDATTITAIVALWLSGLAAYFCFLLFPII